MNVDHYQLIDGSEMWPDKVDATMKQLYQLLGVDNRFKTPLFKKDFHGLMQRALEFSVTSIDIYGYNLLLRLALHEPAETGLLSQSFNIEIAHCQHTLPVLGKNDKEVELALLTTQAQWLGLPVKLREYLLRENILQQALEEEILPTWGTVSHFIKQNIEQRWGRLTANSGSAHEIRAECRLRQAV